MKSPPRYELLFALDDPAAEALIASASRHVSASSAGESISDCYYESSDKRGRKNTGRRQYRVRRINRAWDVSLESLRWERGMCSLRQTVVPSSDLANLQSDVVDKSWGGKWFHKKLLKHNLFPSLETHFHSRTWTQETLDGEIRLTVESGIQANLVPAQRSAPAATFAVTANLVRMSFDVSLPAAFKALIYEFTLLPEQPNILLDLARAAAKASVRESLRDRRRRISAGTHRLSDVGCEETRTAPEPAEEVAICQLG